MRIGIQRDTDIKLKSKFFCTQIYSMLFRNNSRWRYAPKNCLQSTSKLRAQKEEAQSVSLFGVITDEHQQGPSSTFLELVSMSGNVELSVKLSLTLS